MASSPRPRGEIKRVPVPVRHSPPAPDPISTTTTSPPVIAQATLSSSLPSTQIPFIVHGQSRPRGPIPIVATNSHQPLPTHFSHGPRHNHYSQPPYPYTLHTIEMDRESQNRHSTLPAQVEEDIKAAVLASMLPNDPPVPMKRRKTAVHRKNIRWTSLSLLIILVIGEIPVSAIFNIDIPALFAFILVSTITRNAPYTLRGTGYGRMHASASAANDMAYTIGHLALLMERLAALQAETEVWQ